MLEARPVGIACTLKRTLHAVSRLPSSCCAYGWRHPCSRRRPPGTSAAASSRRGPTPRSPPSSCRCSRPASAPSRTPEGRFDIPDVPVGKQTLVVSVIGYGLVRRDVEVMADQATELTIPVAEGASTYVEEVTVAASAFREAEPAAPSQSVLGSRELLALRGVLADDPFRAVQTLPGVTTGDDFKGEFAVRGLGPQHIGISVDGVDSPFLFHTVRAVEDTGSLALINSDILDQAVLLAGPHPQKLGSHLGARLDFTTREGTRSGFAARALVSGSAATGLFEGPDRIGQTRVMAGRGAAQLYRLAARAHRSGNRRQLRVHRRAGRRRLRPDAAAAAEDHVHRRPLASPRSGRISITQFARTRQQSDGDRQRALASDAVAQRDRQSAAVRRPEHVRKQRH